MIEKAVQLRKKTHLQQRYWL